MNPQEIIDDLLGTTGVSRVTLRQAAQDGYFGISHEALAPGTPSVRGERTVSLRTNRVAQQAASGHQVVHNDCPAVDDDPEFRRMLSVYGGLMAQIVTPVTIDSRVVGIVSVHQLGRTRVWTEEEIELCKLAAKRLAVLLSGSGSSKVAASQAATAPGASRSLNPARLRNRPWPG